MGENAFEKSLHLVKLAPTVMDLVDILAERNRRKGRGSITRAEVIRDAVNLLLEHTARTTRRHSNAATEAQDVGS